MAESPEFLTAQDLGSFAYLSMKDRTPQILTKAIDTLHRHKSEFLKNMERSITLCYPEGICTHVYTHKHNQAVCPFVLSQEGVEAEKKAISLLSKLRNELQTDKAIVPWLINAMTRTCGMNTWSISGAFLNDSTGEPRWFFSPWLFVECYMYRRIHEAMVQSPPIHDFDVFKESKDSNFFESQESIDALCLHLQQLRPVRELSEKQLKEEFLRLLQISLWGNKCDLSLSGGESSSQKTNVINSLEDLKPFILINDTEFLWALLSKCKKTAAPPVVRVDIVLDNSGFELLTDLVLADFLLSSELATEIHFHGKMIPWFVSDVTVRDFNWIVDHVKDSNQKATSACGADWDNYVKTGRWIYHDHIFWTLPHPYCVMPQVTPDLYAELQKACLVLFKGI